MSVYADPSVAGVDENAPLGTLEDETVEEITGATYGPLKALCEKAVDAAMGPRRALHVRSGLIVGPHDLSDRFTYWPARVARGGEILAPGDPTAPVQFIDVRDIAAWTLQAAAQRLSGPYNVTGPADRLAMETCLHTCRAVAAAEGYDVRGTTFTWVDDEFLLANEAAAYTEIPLWVPAAYAGFGAFDHRKALMDGLTFRPLAETVRDTLAWQATRPPDYAWRAGLTPEREAELLARWRSA
jgi:2'-hydroxyisoflavone reductase